MVVVRRRDTGATLLDVPLDTLAGATLAYANLIGTVLTGANLQGAGLRDSDLSLASLNCVRLTDADLKRMRAATREQSRLLHQILRVAAVSREAQRVAERGGQDREEDASRA